MVLDMTSLKNATTQLEKALNAYDSKLMQENPEYQTYMRGAVIQAFKFTYEITFKMLKRYLIETAASPATIKEMTFNKIIREAYAKNIICSDVTVWRKYRKNRGTTSRAYCEDVAQEIFEGVAGFLQDVRYTLSRLKEMNTSID